MKKKIFLITIMAFIFVSLLAFSVDATEIDYDEIATLADGTMLPIYDEENNPLIWYVTGTDETGKNMYASVPNNRGFANANKDSYVTYTINTSWMTQLENINIHIWNENLGEYEIFTEENLQVVIVNLRGISKFEYINKGLKISDIQYIYFNEELKDFCEYFKGSTALQLVDLLVCSNLSGGFGGNRNFFNCTNLHTIRLASGTEYTLKCSVNNNWRFGNTAITEMIFPSNITNIGIDNFKNCKQLTSIYFLGNTTSLGQRNFLGCDNLTYVYFLGDNPQIDITSIKDNFYQCVDGNTTYDFTGVGKYFFFVSENAEYLSQVKEAIGADAIISYAEYVTNPSNYVEGRYIISGANICDVYYGEHEIDQETANPCAGVCNICKATVVNHTEIENLSVSVEYEDFLKMGTKIITCCNEGCVFKATEKINALFECLGYSASENGYGGIAVGYIVDSLAIAEYTKISGNTLDYGVFAVLKSTIGNSELFDENGIAVSGVVCTEISRRDFKAFELKVTGFTPEQYDIELAIGAYVVAYGESAEYSYLQAKSPCDGEKYSFISYNDIKAESFGN